MAMKKLRDLGYADLGAAVRYEFGGDSVTQGNLERVSHSLGFTSIKIDGIAHNATDADAELRIFTVEEVRAEESTPEI